MTMTTIMTLLIQKRYQKHIPCSFAYKAVRIDDKFSRPFVLYRGKNGVILENVY